ncbi:hypothetical protein H6G33_10505 [Calothrix sp. FACHB-1219]|uniref:hypothetical protein n=1 Tax=unclassified Calothrix TaxID=2619626 RepID=UPI0016885C80|nr:MULTISPECIES: hypothetical protein [unclassified Calothrix]MBD2201778.1 hypothetical protein [Calothrix sp. FACHB-168]MBD2217464.1 hypothetical protein [Calothrix sp. FACHB-1219]
MHLTEKKSIIPLFIGAIFMVNLITRVTVYPNNVVVYESNEEYNIWKVCFYDSNDELNPRYPPKEFLANGSSGYYKSVREAKYYLRLYGEARNRKATAVILKVGLSNCNPVADQNSGERVIKMIYDPENRIYRILDSKKELELLKEPGESFVRFGIDRKPPKKK